MIRKARTLATALCCIAVSTAALAYEDPSYRLLKLDGHEVRWTMPSHGPLILTYKIVNKPTATPGARTCAGGLTSFGDLAITSKLDVAAIKAEVAAAFRMWEGAANIKFIETESDDAQILLGTQMDPVGWAFADVFFDPKNASEIKPISKGLVCLNPTKPWKIGFGGENSKAYDLLFTFAHEIGHVIGLDHPQNAANSIMGFKYHERFRSLQPGDIYAASKLYGKPVTILVGKP